MAWQLYLQTINLFRKISGMCSGITFDRPHRFLQTVLKKKSALLGVICERIETVLEIYEKKQEQWKETLDLPSTRVT